MLRVGTKIYPNTAKDKFEAPKVAKPKPTKKAKADA